MKLMMKKKLTFLFKDFRVKKFMKIIIMNYKYFINRNQEEELFE